MFPRSHPGAKAWFSGNPIESGDLYFIMKYSDNKTNYQRKLAHPIWQKKRLEVLTRDGFQCQHCLSESKELHVHHKYYLTGKEPHDYPLDAFETLCFECHERETEELRDITDDLPLVLKQAGCDAFLMRHLAGVFMRQMPCDKDRCFTIIETLSIVMAMDDHKPGYIKNIWADFSELSKEIKEGLVNA